MPKGIRIHEDITLQQFGDGLLVTGYAGIIKGKSYYYVRCKHGNEHLIRADDLKSGKRKGCRCKKEKQQVKPNARHNHGERNTPEYRAWVRYKADLPEVWKDFTQFRCDVGEKPNANSRLSRRDMSQPHGPNNTYWRDTNAERKQLAELDYRDELCFDFDAILRAGKAAEERTTTARPIPR